MYINAKASLLVIENLRGLVFMNILDIDLNHWKKYLSKLILIVPSNLFFGNLILSQPCNELYDIIVTYHNLSNFL